MGFGLGFAKMGCKPCYQDLMIFVWAGLEGLQRMGKGDPRNGHGHGGKTLIEEHRLVEVD